MGIHVFYSYSHKDERYRKQLETHLAILRRRGLIEDWSDRKIAPGADWKEEINLNLEKAKIVLLLVSANFLASDYCYETEMIFALERHGKTCIVIPIIIKPCSWRESHFAHLQAVPRDGIPVINWRIKEEAWMDVENGIRRAIESHATVMEAKDFSRIHFGTARPLDETAPLDKLLLQFLTVYNRWYFSPLRIQKWGSQQKGFEGLLRFSTIAIRKNLEGLQEEGKVKATKSQKGNLLYKIS